MLQPWQILVAAMAGWITRQQDAVISYLQEENASSSNSSGGSAFG